MLTAKAARQIVNAWANERARAKTFTQTAPTSAYARTILTNFIKSSALLIATTCQSISKPSLIVRSHLRAAQSVFDCPRLYGTIEATLNAHARFQGGLRTFN